MEFSYAKEISYLHKQREIIWEYWKHGIQPIYYFWLNRTFLKRSS